MPVKCVPAIPFPNGLDRNLERIIAPIKETLDIWAGRQGDDLCQVITLEDLLNSDVTIQIATGVSGSFVQKAGDTMTGNLNINASLDVTGNLTFDSGQAVDTIDTTVDGSSLDTDLVTGKAVYDYAEGAFVSLNGDTMTGKLQVNNDIGLTGNLQFDAGQTVDTIDTTVDGSSLDTDLVTGKAVYDYVEARVVFQEDANGNIFGGTGTGASIAGADRNFFAGINVAPILTSGVDNILIGENTGRLLTTQYGNIHFGTDAGYNNIGSGSILIGQEAAYYQTNAGGNIVIGGYRCGYYNQTGYDNVKIGGQAGYGASGKSHSNCTFIGAYSGYRAGNGGQNTGVGSRTLYNNADGQYNVGIGYQAGYGVSGNDYNNCVFIGWKAGFAVLTATDTLCLGYRAGQGLTTGSYNVYLGPDSGLVQQTSSYNVALGYQSLAGTLGQVADNNVALGVGAGYGISSGDNNLFAGYQAGYSIAAGSGCVFLGYQAGYNETTSNRLYIANSNTATPLVYGEFDNAYLQINGNFQANGTGTFVKSSGTTVLTVSNLGTAAATYSALKLMATDSGDGWIILADPDNATVSAANRLEVYADGSTNGISLATDADDIRFYVGGRAQERVYVTADALTYDAGKFISLNSGANAVAVTFENDGYLYWAKQPLANKGSNTNLTELMRLDNDGVLTVVPDTDTQHKFGRALLGGWGVASDYALFTHVDRTAATNYGFLAYAGGSTFMNSASGQICYIRSNNVSIIEASTGLVDVTGALQTSSTITATGKITAEVDTGGVYDSTTVALVAGDTDDADNVYIIGNTIQSGFGSDAAGSMWLNYRGYNGGTTRLRDLIIGQGQGVQIARFTASNARFQLYNGVGIDEFSTDGTMAGNSDTAVPTEQAVVEYIDSDIWKAYGEIYCHDASASMSVSSSGWTQVTNFDTNGLSANATPDHTNDHITIDTGYGGDYMVNVSISAENSAGVGHVIECSLFKNNGATEFLNVHAHRTLGTGSDKGSISMSGICTFAAGDTIELWIQSDSASARNIVISDCTLSIHRIGGI